MPQNSVPIRRILGAAKAKPAPVMPAQPEPPPDVKPTFDPKLMPSGVLAGITTQVPQPESAPAAHSVMRIDPSKMPDAIGPSTQLTPGQIPQPPTGAQNPNRVGWLQKQAEDLKPLTAMQLIPKPASRSTGWGWGSVFWERQAIS